MPGVYPDTLIIELTPLTNTLPGVVITRPGKRVGRVDDRACSVRDTVTDTRR
jgi:hypothetical protein